MGIALTTRSNIGSYIQVLKPRETALIVFIGTCSSLMAASTLGGMFPVWDFLLALFTVTIGSAGANGLTNYLDRKVDAKMKRTCSRVLPAGKIVPAEKALWLSLIAILTGLVLSWILAPICILIGLTGVLASALWRKTISCTFLGIIAGSAPVLIGWYAITKQPVLEMMPLILFLMITFWTPLHVWTLMLSNRSDYENAGLRYFPLNLADKTIIKLLAVMSVGLACIAVAAYLFTKKMGLLYLVVSSVLTLFMVGANIRLLSAPTSKNAWYIYKLSAFPYLGFIFTAMAMDSWVT